MRVYTGVISCCLLGLGAMAVSPSFGAAAKTEQYEMFVLNDPAQGKEEQFNRWYDLQHAQDVLINPGYTTSQRFAIYDMQLPEAGATPPKYLIRFKIDTTDIGKTLEFIHANQRNGKTIMSDTIGRGKSAGGDFTYKALSRVMPGKSASARGGRAEASFIQIVFSSANPGQEAQFNSRYDAAIAKDLAAAPNLVRWQRYKTSPTQLTQGHMAMTQDYMTIYELNPRDITDLVTVRQRIADAEARALSGVGKVATTLTYRAIGPILTGVDVKRERAAAGANYKPAVPAPPGMRMMGPPPGSGAGGAQGPNGPMAPGGPPGS